MDNETVDKHESYGMIAFSRVTSTPPANFFGSSVRSGHYIMLRVKRASRRRGLNQYWYYGDEELIELRLSPNQFAELLTTMNVGDGVPCTLERVAMERMDDCPAVDQRQTYQDEFKEDMRKVAENAHKLEHEIIDMFFDNSTRITQKMKVEIKSKLRALVSYIDDRAPFVQSQFNEAMDKTVVEAKSEVEAFINNKIHSLGINAFNEEIVAALNAPLESEPLQLHSGEGEQ